MTNHFNVRILSISMTLKYYYELSISDDLRRKDFLKRNKEIAGIL